ncbi:MAG: alpha/beta hydrolase [Pseudomonadota bacterium]
MRVSATRSGLLSILAFLASCLVAEPVVPQDSFEAITYRRLGDIELQLHVYRPAGWQASDRRPAVVFFFGGGWRTGTLTQFDPQCQHLAREGIVAIAADYRVRTRHNTTPIDSVADARAAMGWVRENAARLGINPKRIAAGGGSAGGHLAAAVATIGQSEERPNALILFNPALDIGSTPRVAQGFGVSQEALIEISPYHQVTRDLPPAIIFHGTADTTVPFSSVEQFVAKASALGVDTIELFPYPGRTHGFFNFREEGNPDYDDTVARVDRFLQKLGWLE